MGARSVAFTYNDPVIFLEYAVDVAAACREAGLKTVAVTAGYITADARKELFGVMDATNIDLKGFTEDFYRTLCTAALRPVLETLEYVKHETRCWLEITTSLIPERMTYQPRLRPKAPGSGNGSVLMYRFILRPFIGTGCGCPANAPPRRFGRHVGSLRSRPSIRLYGQCSRSGGSNHLLLCVRRRLIGRDWYDITAWHLSADGRCTKCGTRCAGVFEADAGRWGPRRQPVRLRASEPELLEQ